MKEMKMGGKTFYYEKVCADKFHNGACAFRVKDEEGDENWWVVVPPTLKAQMDGMVIDCPDDGHIAAFCMSEQDALMLASSVCIAAGVAAKDKAGKKALAEVAEKVAKDIGFDIDKMKDEVKKLREEGKSAKEIQEILKPRMNDFLTRKPDAKQEGGEW